MPYDNGRRELSAEAFAIAVEALVRKYPELRAAEIARRLGMSKTHVGRIAKALGIQLAGTPLQRAIFPEDRSDEPA